MPEIRQPSTGGSTTSSLTLLIDGLTYAAINYYQLDLICYDLGIRVAMKNKSGAGGSSGNYRSGTHTFTGLNSGVYYRFYVEARYNSGSKLVRIPASSYTSFMTDAASTPPPKPSYPPSADSSYGQQGGRGARTLYVQIDSLSGATEYHVRAVDSDTGSTARNVYTTYTRGITIDSLSYGKTYSLSYRGYNANGYGSYSNTSSMSTLPEPPAIKASSTSSSSISIGLQYTPVGNWTSVTVKRYTSSGSYLDSKSITSSTGKATWTGLSSGTSYRFAATTYWNSLYSHTDSPTITVSTVSAPANATVAPYLDTRYGTSGRGNRSFYVAFSSLTGATSYEVEATASSTGATRTITTSLTSGVLVDNLSFGTSYTIRYRGVNGSLTGGWSPTNSASTLPEEAVLLGTAGNNSIRVQLAYAPSNNWDYVRVERYTTTGTTPLDSKDILTSGGSVEWTGLASGATYKFKARTVWGTLESFSYSPTIEVTTNVRPINWRWTTNANASGYKTTTSTTGALMNATEWNDFQDRINEFRAYRGTTVFTFYTYYYSATSFTRAKAGDLFYAYFFNQARQAIGSMVATGMVDKTAGDILYASDFNTLMDKLNSIT